MKEYETKELVSHEKAKALQYQELSDPNFSAYIEKRTNEMIERMSPEIQRKIAHDLVLYGMAVTEFVTEMDWEHIPTPAVVSMKIECKNPVEYAFHYVKLKEPLKP